MKASFRRLCIKYHYTSAAGVPTPLHAVCTHFTSSTSGLHALLRMQARNRQKDSHQMPQHPAPPRPLFVLSMANARFDNSLPHSRPLSALKPQIAAGSTVCPLRLHDSK